MCARSAHACQTWKFGHFKYSQIQESRYLVKSVKFFFSQFAFFFFRFFCFFAVFQIFLLIPEASPSIFSISAWYKYVSVVCGVWCVSTWATRTCQAHTVVWEGSPAGGCDWPLERSDHGIPTSRRSLGTAFHGFRRGVTLRGEEPQGLRNEIRQI